MRVDRSTLLFVDDEPRILDGVRRSLRAFRHEWDVEVAAGGEEALTLLRTRTVDFLVTDMRMPQLTGAELLERVRDMQPHAVRFVLSGQTDFEAAMRSLSLAHQFLGKPCAPQAMLEKLLRVREAMRNLEDDRARAAVASLTTLPSPPDTYASLERALAADSNADEVAAIIASDAAMSAKVLQVARSPFFGSGAGPADVAEASRHLGIVAMRALFRHAFRSAASPADCADADARGSQPSLAERVGSLVHAAASETRSSRREDVGVALLRLWGVV